MKEQIAQIANSAAQSPKVGAAILATTTGSTTSIILNFAPVVSVVTGLVSATSLIIYICINIREHRIKMKLMEKELEKANKK